MEKQVKELPLIWLLIGNLVESTGMSFIWPLTTIYMHDYLGKSLTVAGVVLFIGSMTMIAGNYTGGYLYDHKDARHYLLLALTLSLFATGFLVFESGWPYYPLMIILNNFAIGVSGTIVNSLATTIKRYDSRYVFNLMYFMANVGVVLGTLGVGFVINISVRLIFIINFVMFAVFFVIASLFYKVPKNDKHHLKQAKQAGMKTRRYAVYIITAVLIAYFVIQLGYAQWQSNLSVYMEKLGISLSKYSLLWTINGVIIVCLQPIISWIDEHYNVDIFKKVYLGIGLFVVAYSSLIVAHAYWMFIMSMVIVTVGEVCLFPAIPTVVDKLSSASEKGKYQGQIGIAASLGHAIGPLFGGVVIEHYSYGILFTLMALGVFMSEVWLILCRRLKAKIGDWDESKNWRVNYQNGHVGGQNHDRKWGWHGPGRRYFKKNR